MTEKQFAKHKELMIESIEMTRGVQQLLERLIDISNTNLNENGQSKQILDDILNELSKK
ncbi:hypothetical protein [Pseudotenacibaculum haliotis]|uniref:Phage protein n=1 Tax=Pseudotenacibaculum haliotis TaxID=1862138 RepID=A0ABW5LST5_9FLAO